MTQRRAAVFWEKEIATKIPNVPETSSAVLTIAAITLALTGLNSLINNRETGLL